jgi:hypothetical protein
MSNFNFKIDDVSMSAESIEMGKAVRVVAMTEHKCKEEDIEVIVSKGYYGVEVIVRPVAHHRRHRKAA